MYTLLVIDMQTKFLNRFDSYEIKNEVIFRCRQAVLKAIADGAEIIEVKYVGTDGNLDYYGNTIEEISNLWKQYKKYFPSAVKTVYKKDDGGGEEVLQAKPQYEDLIVCGINLGACVGETVYQLRKHKQNVRIIQEAVANSWGERSSCDVLYKDIYVNLP